jgi:hypothetical protein
MKNLLGTGAPIGDLTEDILRLLQSNSAAVEGLLTKSAYGSRAPSPVAGSAREEKDATAEVR